MKRLDHYVNMFFEKLEIFEDKNTESTHSSNIKSAIINFLNTKTDSTAKALDVYNSFSQLYWMNKKDDSIIKMIYAMKEFEQKAGYLLNKQRDHFIHSVNVFILGLSIYINNSKYLNDFDSYIKESGYKDYYTTKHEEFFYTWGITALFHDIAYPIEISYKQLKLYLNFISSQCGLDDKQLDVNIFIQNSNVFNFLPKIHPKKEFMDEFNEKYPDFNIYDNNSLSLIAKDISRNLGINFDLVENWLFDYLNIMEKNKNIDHGYYGSLIILRWFYQLMLNQEWNPAYFYFPIVNSATAIMLHNSYKYGLMKEPFNKSQLDSSSHPLGYMLILCDEIQDWGRQSFGKDTLGDNYPDDILINLENNNLNIKYIFSQDNSYCKSFALKKINKLKEVIRLESIFNNVNIK